MRRALLLVVVASAASADERDACKSRGGSWVETAREVGCKVKGKRDGLWLDLLAGGRVGTSATYEAGVLEGPWVKYHGNCRVAERGAMKKGERDGAWSKWTEAGVKVTEGSYAKGKREGQWTFFDADDGQKQIAGPFVADQGEGLFTEWFSVGTKWRDFPVKAGQRAGEGPEGCKAKGGDWTVDHRARTEGCKINRQATGVWTTYYPSGAVRSRVHWVDGQIHGETEELHEGGALLHRGSYLHGVPDGIHEFKAPDGTPYGTSTIAGGSGAWKAFLPNGKVGEEGSYKQGQKDGVWTMYDDEGRKKMEATYVAGSPDGPFRAWFKNGELAAEGQYARGVRSGFWKAYFPNGHLEWEGRFDGGRRVGFWVNFRWGGPPESMGDMADDVREGTWVLFHEDGKIKGIGTYVGDRRDGVWQEFWATGEPWRRVTYVDDAEDSAAAKACGGLGGQWLADPERRALGCQVCRAKPDDSIEYVGYGHWTFWHPNGAIEKEGDLVAGQKEGVWRFNYDNGEEMLQGAFKGGKENGVWTGAYRDGQQRFRGAYRDGEPTGDWTSYTPDGQLLSAGRYDAGKKVGRWSYAKRNGGKDEIDY